MATESVCLSFFADRDYACLRDFISKFYQEAVLIKKKDIATLIKSIPSAEATDCQYSITELTLATGLSGFRIKLDGSASVIKGYVSKSKDDKGMVQYLHKVDVLAGGISEQDMCNLDALDHELWVVALQAVDGTVIIYGADNGLTTADYEYDIVANAGAVTLTLQSDETAQERYLPLVYFNTDAATTNADFNDKFAAP